MSTRRKRISDEDGIVAEVKTPFTAKKRRTAANNNTERTLEQLRMCNEVLDDLKTLKSDDGRIIAEAFLKNPSKRSDPEYYKVVKNPMDIARMQQKLRTDEYSQVSEFFEDFNLMIVNSLEYYKEGSDEHRDSLFLREIFEEKKGAIESAEIGRINGEIKVNTTVKTKEPPTPSPSVSNRSKSPSVTSSYGVNGSGEGMDESTAEDMLTTILELTDETKRLLSPPFRLLQTPEEFPLYYEKIKSPIDLKTIAEKTRAGCYTSIAALEADFKLLCKNAKVFNEPGSLIHKDADRILKALMKKKGEILQGKTPNKQRIEHCRETVDSLIAQSSTEDTDGYSEDSEEDEELEQSTEWGWQLYWTVRNVTTDDEDCISDPFLELPSKHYYPDYYDEIKHPMSLFMINRKLKAGQYESLEGLVDDFMMVYDNAMEYNVEGSDIYDKAKELREVTLKKAKQVNPTMDIKKWTDICGKSSPDNETSTPVSHKKKTIVVKREEDDIDDGTSDSQSDATPPPSKRRNRKMRPISTGMTPLPESKPGRKSLDELMLRFRVKLMNFWTLLTEYREDAYWPMGAFMDLPDRKLWSEYYKVIDVPLSMNIIKDRIENNQYNSSSELMADFHIMFKNAKTFNEPGSDLHRDATRLEKMVNEAHSNTKDAPYESPLILKEKMGWLKTKLPMYSAKSKNPTLLNGLPGAVSSDDDCNSISSIRSPAPCATPSTPTYRPKIPLKERMEKLPEEGKRMFHLLLFLREYKDDTERRLAALFLKLPHRHELPQYYEVIKKPLDFARIQQKLSSSHYRSPADLVADIQMMFDNACKFNEPESQIYKDAITLQKVLLIKKKELFQSDESSTFSVQMELRSLFTSLFVSVFNKKDVDGRCFSDSFVDLPHLIKTKIPETQWPFSFDQIKRNIDKGRYKRLDRFQNDLFCLFETARKVARSDSMLFDDATELQYEYLRVRDETLKNVIVSTAFMQRQKDLEETITTERTRKAIEEVEQEKKEDEMESEEKQLNGTKETQSLPSIIVNDKNFSTGDYVLVSPSEKEVKEPHLMRIESIVKEEGGAILVKGIWFYRPHETFHLPTKKFAHNEVFLTKFRDTVTSDRLLSRACVLQPKQLTKFIPTGFDSNEVFMCEERYLGKQLHFKKIKIWPFSQDDDTFTLEEREETLAIVRVKRDIIMNGVKEDDDKSQSSISSQDSNEEDERCANCIVLDVPRMEVKVREEEDADGRTAYQQIISTNGKHYALGDCVLVFNPHRPKCDIMRIDRLWREKDGSSFFSGGLFTRCTDVYHDCCHLFFRREVFAVVQCDQTRPLDSIQSKCAVLPLKQYVKERPTEIPECDVFVCESRVVGTVDASTSQGSFTFTQSSIFHGPVQIEKTSPFNAQTAKHAPKLKQYSLSSEVANEEFYVFRTPMNMEKEPSPLIAKAEEPDLDVDEVISDTDATESVGAKELVSWLSHQPKLNSKSKSGYILFSAEIRKRIMHENPEAGFGEVSKIVGIEWKKLTEDQKKQYEVRAEYIANERAKQEAATIASAKEIQPGQVKVYMCRWINCDFQFDCAEGLTEHVIHYHTSQIIVDGENQYVCMWMTCVRNRKDGKPFPSLPRLHRHVKEKHITASGSYKIIAAGQRSKNYFKWITTGGENGAPVNGQLAHFPFGLHPNAAQVNGMLQNGPLIGHGCTPQLNGHSHVPHHQQETPRVNGIDPRYHHPSQSHNAPPHGMFPSNAPTPSTGHGIASTNAQPHGSNTQQMTCQASVDARTVVTMGRTVEAVFVPPPSSVHARRVLHSEAYLRYIEALSNGRQRTVSQFDRSLRAHPRNTSANANRSIGASWIRESRGGRPVREDEVVRALWRLREELLQSTSGVERDYSGVL